MKVALGAMNFGKRTDESESKRIIDRAFELGVRHIDTANAYTDGNSERIVGKAIKSRRADVTLATKVGFGRMAGGKPEGLSRTRIFEAIDESLGRLGTDYVDIYYLHVPDHATPIEESLDALAELYEKKKIRSWGISNYGAWQALEMIHKARSPQSCRSPSSHSISTTCSFASWTWSGSRSRRSTTSRRSSTTRSRAVS